MYVQYGFLYLLLTRTKLKVCLSLYQIPKKQIGALELQSPCRGILFLRLMDPNTLSFSWIASFSFYNRSKVTSILNNICIPKVHDTLWGSNEIDLKVSTSEQRDGLKVVSSIYRSRFKLFTLRFSDFPVYYIFSSVSLSTSPLIVPALKNRTPK